MKMNFISVKVPQDHYIRNGSYYGPKGQLTEWTIVKLGLFSLIDSQKQEEKCIRFYIKTQDNEADTVTLDCSFSSAISGKVYDIFEEKQLYVDCSRYQFSKFIANIVKNTVKRNPFPENDIVDQGFMRLPSEKMVFGLGEEMINANEEDPVISTSCLTLKNSDDDRNYISYISCLINNFPPAAFISTLASFVKPIFENELVQFGFTVYIYGQSGTGKTELAKLLADIYEDHNNMVSLSSDKYALKKQGQLKDIPIVIDDLNRSASSRIRNSNEAKISDFIQMNQGGGNCCNKDIKLRFNHVAIITAEYVMKNNSTVNRCLLVEIEECFNSCQLSKLQREHGKYLSFLKSFISWLCVNHDLLSEQSEFYLKRNKKRDTDYKDSYVGSQRIMRTHQILDITLDIFVRYLKEVHSLSAEQINEISAICKNSIDKCIADTLGHCPSGSTKIGKDFVDTILSGLDYYIPIVSNDFKKYHREINQAKKSAYLPDKIFYFNGAYLCIEPDILVSWLKTQTGLKTITTKKRISAQLKYYGLLKVVGGEYTSYIAEDKKHKYYQLPLQRLKELEADKRNKFLNNNDHKANDIVFEWDYTSERKIYGKWAVKTDDNEQEYEDYQGNDLYEE